MKIQRRSTQWLAVMGLISLGALAYANDASTQPTRVDATKKEQIEAAVDGLSVVVTGTVASASWTGPGKMLVIKFKGAPEEFQVLAPAKLRGKLDKAFSTDITMSIEGRAVEITGNLTRYKGKAAGRKGMIELTVAKPAQIKLKE